MLHSLPVFSHFPPLPTSKFGLSGAASQVGGLCMFCDPVGLCNDLSCEAGISPTATSTTTGVFNQRFEALFPRAGTLGCTSVTWSTSCCLTGQLQLCPPGSTIRQLAGSTSRHLAVNPVRPGCPAPPLPPDWMKVSSLSRRPWSSDFHTV